MHEGGGRWVGSNKLVELKKKKKKTECDKEHGDYRVLTEGKGRRLNSVWGSSTAGSELYRAGTLKPGACRGPCCLTRGQLDGLSVPRLLSMKRERGST